MSGNTGFLFFKEYYDGVDWRNLDNNKFLFESKSKEIKEATFIPYHSPIQIPHRFTLKTTYPGLVLGTGYQHETGVEGEFKIGFYFDYTTGLPVIPGSSIKGILRSVFPGRGNRHKTEKTEYIRNLLGKDENFNVLALEHEIFEGIRNNNATKASEKYIPIYKRDIFHDAFPVRVGEDGLFNDDFITRHEKPLKNPIPLKFLKVSPGVSFQFNFDLKDSPSLGVTAEDKLKLFLNILLDIGIGAKTNVGYGRFDDSDRDGLLNDISKQIEKKKEQERLASMTDNERKNAEKEKFMEEIKDFNGKPSELFIKWKENKYLTNEKEIAQTFVELFITKKLMPSKPQLKYLAKVLGVDKGELKKEIANKISAS